MKKKTHGELLTPTELMLLQGNYILGYHSEQRLLQRSDFVCYNKEGKIDYCLTMSNISKAIKNNVLAYYNTDGSINVAINRWEYFVFVWDNKMRKYVMVTFKEKSHNNIDIFKKRELAVKGYDRKEN